MSRYVDDRYDDRRTNVSRRRYDDEEYEVRSRYDGPPPSRRPPAAETLVRERDADTVISQGRRPAPRQPDFLREDYGRNPNAGPLVVREERREDDYVSRAPTRRRSLESVRSRGPPGPPERTEKEEIIFRESDRESRGPPYPRSERGGYDEKEEITFRDTRSRPPPSTRGAGGYEEKTTEIRFKEDEKQEWMPPRREYRDRDAEEIKFRRGGGDRPSPPPPAPTAPPPRTEVDREEITFTRREHSRERSRAPPPRHDEREEITFTRRETSRERSRAPPPRSTYDREEIQIHERRSSRERDQYRGRNDRKDVDIDIDIDINKNERSAPPPPRQRSQSRGQLVGRKHEEWIVRRERTPTPPPPPKDFEREQIIIRQRRERTPSPEPPPREPTPEPTPPPPPPVDPIYRPPIIQEVITHHRTIDHGVERARSPTPPPPPAPLPPPPPAETKEDDLQIEIRRTGTRNGKAYEDDIIFESERKERDVREPSRHRSRSTDRHRARSYSRDRVDNREVAIRSRSRYDDRVGARYNDEVAAEADYYNRKVSGRGYPGEAYNGATKDWGLVDIPPGTSRVAMDGAGGGRQEITWDRYAGERHSKFYTGDRVYEQDWGRERNGYGPPLPPPERPREQRDDVHIDIKINEETRAGKTKDKMWTEITKDLVIKEAIEERGYEYEETDEFFYVMVYLRYVRSLTPNLTPPSA